MGAGSTVSPRENKLLGGVPLTRIVSKALDDREGMRDRFLAITLLLADGQELLAVRLGSGSEGLVKMRISRRRRSSMARG
jgi:hypothetical protein